jgi:hypothetical protein
MVYWTWNNHVRFQVLMAASMKFRIVFWDVLPCKIIVDRRFRCTCCLMMEAARTSETYVGRKLFYTAVHPKRQFWTWKNHVFGLCPSSKVFSRTQRFGNLICFHLQVKQNKGGLCFIWRRIQIQFPKHCAYEKTLDDGHSPKAWFFQVFFPFIFSSGGFYTSYHSWIRPVTIFPTLFHRDVSISEVMTMCSCPWQVVASLLGDI